MHICLFVYIAHTNITLEVSLLPQFYLLHSQEISISTASLDIPWSSVDGKVLFVSHYSMRFFCRTVSDNGVLPGIK